MDIIMGFNTMLVFLPLVREVSCSCPIIHFQESCLHLDLRWRLSKSVVSRTEVSHEENTTN